MLPLCRSLLGLSVADAPWATVPLAGVTVAATREVVSTPFLLTFTCSSLKVVASTFFTSSENVAITLLALLVIVPLLPGVVEKTLGAVVSLAATTVTLKLPSALLPAASMAEQLTVVVPNGKVSPDVRP